MRILGEKKQTIISVLVEGAICPRTHVAKYVDGAYGPLHDLPLAVPPSDAAADLHWLVRMSKSEAKINHSGSLEEGGS